MLLLVEVILLDSKSHRSDGVQRREYSSPRDESSCRERGGAGGREGERDERSPPRTSYTEIEKKR